MTTEVSVHLVGGHRDELGFGRGEFEKVGNIGRMQRRHQFAGALPVIRPYRIQNGIDEFALQPIILVMAGFDLPGGNVLKIVRPGFGQIGSLAHRVPYCPVPVAFRCFCPCPS